MASVNKKKKAKNSFLYCGNEAQDIWKMKRIAYYTKKRRKKNKDQIKKELEEYDS